MKDGRPYVDGGDDAPGDLGDILDVIDPNRDDGVDDGELPRPNDDVGDVEGTMLIPSNDAAPLLDKIEDLPGLRRYPDSGSNLGAGRSEELNFPSSYSCDIFTLRVGLISPIFWPFTVPTVISRSRNRSIAISDFAKSFGDVPLVIATFRWALYSPTKS